MPNYIDKDGNIIPLFFKGQQGDKGDKGEDGNVLQQEAIDKINSSLEEQTNKIKDLWYDVKKDFGAKGDWDSTLGTGTDDSDAIQLALDSLNHEVGTKIKLFFPKGSYRITKPIVGHRVKLIGENNVTIIHDGENAYFDFKPINPLAINEFYELFIEGIGFRGKNGAKKGISITKGSQFYIEQIYLYDFSETAIVLNDCTIGNFIRLTLSHNNIGVLLNKVAGVSFTEGNLYANQADLQFKDYNSGIKFYDMWLEDSTTTFLFDNANNRANVGGLYVTHSFFGRNDNFSNTAKIGGAVFTFKSNNTTNLITAQNIVFENNRVNYALSGLENMIDIDLTGGSVNSSINLIIKNNFLYNEVHPDSNMIKAIGNTLDQVRVVYEDNTTSGQVNILDGIGRITGIDRSGSLLSLYNKVRGELILDRPPNSSSVIGAFGWEATYKTPRFYDGVQYRNIQGIHTGSTANRPTSVPIGYQYFDASLNKPIWCKASGNPCTWIDSTGVVV